MYNSLTKVIYIITLTVVDWVDVFTRPIYKHIVIDSLRYCQENKPVLVGCCRHKCMNDEIKTDYKS